LDQKNYLSHPGGAPPGYTYGTAGGPHAAGRGELTALKYWMFSSAKHILKFAHGHLQFQIFSWTTLVNPSKGRGTQGTITVSRLEPPNTAS